MEAGRRYLWQIRLLFTDRWSGGRSRGIALLSTTILYIIIFRLFNLRSNVQRRRNRNAGDDTRNSTDRLRTATNVNADDKRMYSVQLEHELILFIYKSILSPEECDSSPLVAFQRRSIAFAGPNRTLAKRNTRAERREHGCDDGSIRARSRRKILIIQFV